jgi:hypothetical protein
LDIKNPAENGIMLEPGIPLAREFDVATPSSQPVNIQYIFVGNWDLRF